MGGQKNKVGGRKNKGGGQKTRWGGQKNKVGGQKNKVGGRKNKGGVKKTRWGGQKKQGAQLEVSLIEGSLEVKLLTIWTDEKQSREEAERRERLEERRSEKRKSQKKEDADARKGKKVAKNCVFPMICGSGGSKSRLAKAAGAEPAGQMRDKKLNAVVARSTFRSQNVQNTPASDHFY